MWEVAVGTVGRTPVVGGMGAAHTPERGEAGSWLG